MILSFFVFVFILYSLMNLVITPERNFTATNDNSLPLDPMTFKMQLIKNTLMCIVDEDDETYSDKLISFAKQYDKINEEITFHNIYDNAVTEKDKSLIYICRNKVYYLLIKNKKYIREKKLSWKALKINDILKYYKMMDNNRNVSNK